MPAIKHLIEIAASPANVYAAMVSTNGLQGWWTADVEAEAHEGGLAQFGFFQRTMIYQMPIDRLEPANRSTLNFPIRMGTHAPSRARVWRRLHARARAYPFSKENA